MTASFPAQFDKLFNDPTAFLSTVVFPAIEIASLKISYFVPLQYKGFPMSQEAIF